MKFKVGDLVLCIESISPDANGPQLGTMYRVISTNDNDGSYQSIGVFLPKCVYNEETKSGRHANWGANAFKLMSANYIPNEFEHLDNIQRNFKYGDWNYYTYTLDVIEFKWITFFVSYFET